MENKQSAALGIALALTTAVFWGALPIAMKQVLPDMAPETIVWYRFTMAAIGLGGVLWLRGQLPPLASLRQRRWLLWLTVATAGLLGNFILFSTSLQYLSPTTSQVIGQLSPVGLMFASVLVLKERMRPAQAVGAALLIAGLILFFNTSLAEILTRLTDYTLGVLLGMAAAGLWVCYGIAQKILLRRLASQQILWLLYALCAICLWPLAHPEQIYRLSTWQLACLLFCGVNTLVGYGALAEAMVRWQVAKVGAIVTLTPLFTLMFSDILALLWPATFMAPSLNAVGYIGAVVVVAGAMFSAIGHRWWPRQRR